jgi:putative Mn2+ efflux pump MntP
VSPVTLILIALGLSMDAFAVAVATSVSLRVVTRRQVFRFAFHFGLFQFFMPVIGWALGRTVVHWVAAWDHWLAFGLLAYVGGKTIWGELRGSDAATAPTGDPTRGWSLVLLSLATSLDALAVGLSFAWLGVGIVYPSLVIGVVCAGLTVVGMSLGSRVGATFGRRAAIVGGLVLIVIGLNILRTHLQGAT